MSNQVDREIYIISMDNHIMLLSTPLHYWSIFVMIKKYLQNIIIDKNIPKHSPHLMTYYDLLTTCFSWQHLTFKSYFHIFLKCRVVDYIYCISHYNCFCKIVMSAILVVSIFVYSFKKNLYHVMLGIN